MGQQKRLRADVVLVTQKHFPSREKAQEAIDAGRVFIDSRPVSRSSSLVDPHASVKVTPADDYVSRGAHKLAAAFEKFCLSAEGKVVLDAGASTGGFTDYVLRNGAKKVIAVDVGYGQLAWGLRTDSRVELHERTNIRYMSKTDVSELADMAVADLSFISVTKVMGALVTLCRPGAEIVILVKPQFEVEPGQVGKGGIVREASLHHSAIARVAGWGVEEGLILKGLTYSPITGADGNIEYLVYFLIPTGNAEVDSEGGTTVIDIAAVVDEANQKLAKNRRTAAK